MGQVIRKNAAAADIVSDVRTTLTNAVAKQGDWKTTAEARLQPIVTLADGVEARMSAAKVEAAPFVAALDVADDESDGLLGRISDEIWNLVGRPGNDPALDILFPGGTAAYTEGKSDEQPFRMELLAELLEMGIHPRLESANATAYATEIRQSGAQLEEKVDAARRAKARVKLTEKMYQAIARAGAVALGRLKAQWKADGKSEAEIHTVIPDRTRNKSGGGGGGGGGGGA